MILAEENDALTLYNLVTSHPRFADYFNAISINDPAMRDSIPESEAYTTSWVFVRRPILIEDIPVEVNREIW